MTEIERVELNAIIHNQREKLRELNETRDILRKDKRILEQQLQEANEFIRHYAQKNGYHKAMDYLNKWDLKEQVDTLKDLLLRLHPEYKGWIDKNFGEN